MTSSPDLASLGLASLELATLDPGPDPAGEAGGRRRGAGAASPSWQLRPGSGAAAWRRVCAAGAVGTTSRCCHCPARYATAAETEPTHPRGGGGGGGGEEGRMEERMTGERRERQEGRTRGQKRGRQEGSKERHIITKQGAVVSVTGRSQTPPTLGYCC